MFFTSTIKEFVLKCSLLVLSKNLCSKLHCHKYFNLILFSYRIAEERNLRCIKRTPPLRLSLYEVLQVMSLRAVKDAVEALLKVMGVLKVVVTGWCPYVSLDFPRWREVVMFAN